MPHSLQACSAPSKQMPGSNPKGDRSSIASISASSTISIPSYEPSASKPRDFNLKREQNPRYRQHNGLTLLWLGQPGGGFFHGFCDQQRLFLAESKVLDAFVRGQRKHHDFRLVLGPTGGEGGHKIRGC